MNFHQIIQNTIEPTTAKALASFGLFIAFMFGELHTAGVLAVFMLMVLDTILGVWASYYEHECITSTKFARVVQKSIVYLLAISGAYFTDISLGFAVLQPVMIGFVGVTEFISILENIGRMGFHTPKRMLNQLHDYQNNK